jgi:hypothetical protein
MGDGLVCFYGFQLQCAMNVIFEINCGSFHGAILTSKRRDVKLGGAAAARTIAVRVQRSHTAKCKGWLK